MTEERRKTLVNFRVTESENALIAEKMAAAGISNKEAYLRKMALGGYVIRVDFSDIRELSRLLRNATNNLNQIAKHANMTGSVYKNDIKEIRADYEKLWEKAEGIMKKLAEI